MNKEKKGISKLKDVASIFDGGSLKASFKEIEKDDFLQDKIKVFELKMVGSTLLSGVPITIRFLSSYLNWQDLERIENDIKVSIYNNDLVREHFTITL
jgi:hypothetical protein